MWEEKKLLRILFHIENAPYSFFKYIFQLELMIWILLAMNERMKIGETQLDAFKREHAGKLIKIVLFIQYIYLRCYLQSAFNAQ